MAQTVVEILSQKSCATCNNNCKGYCAALRSQIDPVKASQGLMECEGKEFDPLISEYQLEEIRKIWVT